MGWAKQKVTSSIPSPGTCLGCQPSPSWGHERGKAIDGWFFPFLSPSPLLALKINKLNLLKKQFWGRYNNFTPPELKQNKTKKNYMLPVGPICGGPRSSFWVNFLRLGQVHLSTTHILTKASGRCAALQPFHPQACAPRNTDNTALNWGTKKLPPRGDAATWRLHFTAERRGALQIQENGPSSS